MRAPEAAEEATVDSTGQSTSRILTRWSEVATHRSAPGKHKAYRKMLHDFGVDPTHESVAGLGETPAVLFAEQPGHWLTPRDLVRARLLERLIERGGFDPVQSGVRCLAHDRFTADGDKGAIVDFHLHPGLGPVRLVGSSFIKRYEHKTYASLHLQAKSYQRLRDIWDCALRMIESANESADRFVEVTREMFDASPPPGARDVLPATNDSKTLREIGQDLASRRLEPAFKALWPARARLTRDVLWDVYWNAVNSEFLSWPIGSLSPLLGRFVLAIEDPLKLSRHFHRESGAAPGEPVSVVGFADDKNVFRTVLFDPERERFYYEGRRREVHLVDWDEVRQSAADGYGGRPSGPLEYLFLAAFGFYLTVDCGDQVQTFHDTACDIHRRYTGLEYPWMRFAPEADIGARSNCFTDIFRPGFAGDTVDALSAFLDA